MDIEFQNGLEGRLFHLRNSAGKGFIYKLQNSLLETLNSPIKC